MKFSLRTLHYCTLLIAIYLGVFELQIRRPIALESEIIAQLDGLGCACVLEPRGSQWLQWVAPSYARRVVYIDCGRDFLKPSMCKKFRQLYHLEGIGGTHGLNTDDDGLRELAAIATLKELSLSLKSNVTDVGVKHLCSIRGLESLSLDGSDVTDESAQHLVKLRELRQLSLSATKVTDASIPLLATLPRLEKLDIVGTGITNRGIAALGDCKTLRLLVLRVPRPVPHSFMLYVPYPNFTLATEQGVADLKTRLPGIRVRR